MLLKEQLSRTTGSKQSYSKQQLLKVVFILPAPYRNGAVNLIVNLGEELTRQNVAVDLFMVRDCERRAPLPNPPITVDIVLEENQSTLAGLPKLLFRLTQAMLKADVVAFTWENGILLPGLLAFMLRKPTIAIVQNNIQKVSSGSPSYRRERSIRRWVYGRAKAVVCVGSGLTPTIEPGINRKKITSIQNGIDIEKVRRLAKAPPSAQIEPLMADNIPFIVGIGRLSPQKGFDLLISAHAAVIKQAQQNANSNAGQHRLVLIGEGAEKENLIRLAEALGVSDSVVFLGYLSNPYPALARASLFCLSSRYEGFGLVGAEAAALGVPTVAADCVAGPKELLGDGLYGDLVRPESAEALATAIQRHFKDPSRLQKKAAASARDAQRLSMKRCAQRYRDLLHRCAQIPLPSVEPQENRITGSATQIDATQVDFTESRRSSGVRESVVKVRDERS
ncbi:MAG: glycosyltransferase [Cyanobacteria bacterium P01_D01_bin.105]